jgi:hypothetical protein
VTDAPRNKLTIKAARETLIEEGEDKPLALAMLDLTLPCRRFVVEHKVAEVGKVSVTAEFLLRFVRSMGTCTEEAAQTFFGYSRREMAYVLNEVEEAAYLQRSDGRLSLTASGHGLFRPGTDEPLIYDVERKTARVGFDLISLAPSDRRPLSFFEQRLPELPLLNQEQVSSATEKVPTSFRRHFREFAPRFDPTATARRTLYSIDSVTAEERFSNLVRVNLVSSGLKPTQAEIDLSEWRSEYELSDREDVGRAVIGIVEKLTIARREDDPDAYRLLVELAPEYLKEWTRKDGLSVQRFYRHAFTSHGDIRADRPTSPVVGSLFTPENARRLFEAASYGLRKAKRPALGLLWVIPQTPMWGSTSVLPEIIDQLREKTIRANEDLAHRRPVEAVALTAGRPEPWLKEAFNGCNASDSLVFPGGFEMLLVPNAVVAAVVHAPIGAQSGLAVPLGFVSFDQRVIERAMTLLGSNAKRYRLHDTLEQGLVVPELSA